MDKQTLVRRMSQSCGGSDFISLKELSAYLGLKNTQRVRSTFLTDVPKINSKYFIPDVAQSILDHTKYG